MIEVFVGFKKYDDVQRLGDTLEAWDIPGMEPVAIEIKGNKYELLRRVSAENVSVSNYILVEMGYAPVEGDFGEQAEALFAANPTTGLFTPKRKLGQREGQVLICRKGVITHWPQPTTTSYATEHQHAYERAGYATITCENLHYLPLVESLPS